MPVAFAGVGDPLATKSASVTKQIKKLKQRIAVLEAKQIPTSLPPSGPAGGDLAGVYPSPLIAPGAVGGAEINEAGVPIPTAWAVVSDPDGNSQPDGDPRALASEGVENINDGDGGPLAPFSGLQCYGLGFTPDLILASIADQTTLPNPELLVFVHRGAGGVCGSSAGDAYLQIRDATGNYEDGDVHVAFFDLQP